MEMMRLARYRWVIAISFFTGSALYYYFGAVVDAANWTELESDFWQTSHDFTRLLFLFPVIWVTYAFGMKGLAIAAGVSLMAFLPRALLFSPFPYALQRAIIGWIIIVGAGIAFYTILDYRTWQGHRSLSADTTQNSQGTEETGIFTGDGLHVDLGKHLVKRRGDVIKFTRIEFTLLSFMVLNSGRVLSHEELLQNVWGPEYSQEIEYLRNFIRQIRNKIEYDPAQPKFITTEPGFGYRFLSMKAR